MIRIERLSKVFGHGDAATVVLDGLDIVVGAGEIFAVVGSSGAGKSTLVQCVSLLERPSSGSVIVNGEDLSSLSERGLREARRRIGTIFQADGLYSRRTAAENVALPLEYLGVTKADLRRRVGELLERVGLSSRARHYPHQLSGGQRQRVGIARALALRPTVLLSDEATSGLDPESTASIVELLKELRDDLDLSILFITHEMDTVLRLADSVARLEHGRITESGRLVELLRDPESSLGRSLNPSRPALAAAPDSDTWLLSYLDGTVPPDWILRLARTLGTAVSVLGASIESIGGAAVGHATLGVRHTDRDALVRAARELGLDARLAAPAQRPDGERGLAPAGATPARAAVLAEASGAVV